MYISVSCTTVKKQFNVGIVYLVQQSRNSSMYISVSCITVKRLDRLFQKYPTAAVSVNIRRETRTFGKK